MFLEEKAFFNLIIIKMPITGYSIYFEVFFGSHNMEFILFLFNVFSILILNII